MASDLLNALRNRTVLVTGHSGFIGSWLCALLSHLEVVTIGFSSSEDPVSAYRATWLEGLGVAAITGDVRDRAAVDATVQAVAPDVIIHLAAQPLLFEGYRAPHRTFDININGSMNVLDVAVRSRTPAVVHVTSDKCYSQAAALAGPLKEGAELGGEGPYPASKMISEILFREFSMLAGPGRPHMSSVRLGNVIGGGDGADRLVPNSLRAFRAGTPFSVRDPLAIRPFQHVLDVAHGLARLAGALLSERVPSGLPLNFAPPYMGVTVGEIVSALAEAWGPGACVGDEQAATELEEQQVLRLDGSHAAALLAWQHRLDCAEGAAWAVEWTREVDQGTAPADAMLAQIARHQLLSDQLR
ncbi:NAD-dependent epimerase/dehydratase family protein [Promicromonospora sp. NFX87]|uniref:NAD-dependent epimerase/dehydratase family protein n=1 Tax=Promicromonospora sp. NFX87 TaxID=3402691 RepID=UPI003AFA1586